MVLTRSSYSRSGTPLASPLNNPERPETKQRQPRKKQQHVLANLSQQSTSDQNTASPPSSQSPSSSFLLTPITPSNPARFGLELTQRLHHTQLHDQQSILTTPGQLSLQIHQQSIQSSPQLFFTPDQSYLCAKPNFQLRTLESNNFNSSQTLDASHNPTFACQSDPPSSSQPHSTPTALSQDIPNALGFLPHPPAASPQDLLTDLPSHHSDHSLKQHTDIQDSTQIPQSQPLVPEDPPCSQVEIEVKNQAEIEVAAPTEIEVETKDQTPTESNNPVQIEHQIQLEHPIECQIQKDPQKESVEPDTSHSNQVLQPQPPTFDLSTVVDQTKIEVENSAAIVVEDPAQIETTEIDTVTQDLDLELETVDQKHPELDPAKIETSTPQDLPQGDPLNSVEIPQSQPPTPTSNHHPTIETENVVEDQDLGEVEVEDLTEVETKIKPEGQIEAAPQTPTERKIQLVPDQKSAHEDLPNSNEILQSQTASLHPSTHSGNEEAKHAEIVEDNPIEIEVEDQAQINQTPVDLEQAEAVPQIQQDPPIQGELLSHRNSQMEIDGEHQSETEEQAESACLDKIVGPVEIEVKDQPIVEIEDQAPFDQTHFELDHQPENQHPIQQNCHHEEDVQGDPPSRRSSRTEIDEEQHNETEEQAELPTSDEESSSISDHSGDDSITGESSVDDESSGDDDAKSDLEMDDSDDEEIKEILKRAKQEARQSKRQSNRLEAEVGDEMASSDCGSSITFGKNLIRLDEQQDGQKEQSRKPNSLLSQPIKISELERATRNQKATQSNSSLNSTKQPSLAPNPTNFDRVLAIKERQLGLSSSSTKNHQSMDWHDLPVQELTKEVKMEIQAMRLHRTLDPKSFIKGGIEKATKEPIPTKFLFGYVTGGDGSMNGSTTTASSSIKKRSFVESLLHDEKSQEWSKKKYNEVQSAGRSGKHTADNPKKPFKKHR